MKKCVHCLIKLPKKTKDHVFPSSWYTDDTPKNIQRWTVPCCDGCNNRLGAIEKDLFVRLGLCINPVHAQASGISKKALAAIGIGAANIDYREWTRRDALRRKILKDSSPYKDKDSSYTLPGLGLRPGFSKDEHVSISISEKSLIRVSEKIIRGCEYKLSDGRLIAFPYVVESYFPREDNIKFVVDIFEKLPAKYLGPGFEVRRGISELDSMTSLYRIIVWGQIKIYGALAPAGYFKRLDNN